MAMELTSHTRGDLPGSYALRPLIKDVPLTPADDATPAHITCVDSWNGNIYIGSSTGEILHYFQIPPDPNDPDGEPAYILATRIEPEPASASISSADVGVKQILLLPREGKVCILCNGVLQFYSLPELSPGIDGKIIRQQGCLWVGGLDRNIARDTSEQADGTAIVMCLRPRLRLLNIGAQARKIRDIELGGISAIERRGDLACVADGDSYSLLDVVNQRKQELFSISSSADLQPLVPSRPASRSVSSATSPVRQSRGHDRNISLGGQPRSGDRSRPDLGMAWPARASSRTALPPPRSSTREPSPLKVDKPLPEAPETPPAPEVPTKPARPLPPNIISPTANEFMLTTGTRLDEPGVGMFVNLDGDLVPRGALEFSSYPLSIVLDENKHDSSTSDLDDSSRDRVLLALVQKKESGALQKCIEIQKWNVNGSETDTAKEWLAIGPAENFEEQPVLSHYGLVEATSPAELSGDSIGATLRLRRLRFATEVVESTDEDVKRNAEEDRFAARFDKVRANIVLFARDQISWVVRCPTVVQLSRQLDLALQKDDAGSVSVDIAAIQNVVKVLRGRDPRDELEFLTLTYIRQKAALLLFGRLILDTAGNITTSELDRQRTEDALSAAELDPRVVLTMIPPLQEEIAQGQDGIWLPQGILHTLDTLRTSFDTEKLAQDPAGLFGDNILSIMKGYLLSWRKKKGFGSVADEANVFLTIDAALLHVLLLLDQHSPIGPATPGSVRAELNDVVDRGVDCFDRAVELFEQFGRIYMLSRLYQSRKMSAKVLATWKRIIEGEADTGGELTDGELRVRRYLAQIRDVTLVEEYGSWLARRDPKLGAQVFADDRSKIKFDTSEAIAILQKNAPSAVKDYLEHLVFDRNHVQYVNDLVAFYLDNVLSALEGSEEIRSLLLDSYETYRALEPPKPTYRQFVADNPVDAEWWRNRLRLLQLIGGTHGPSSQYDAQALGDRLEPYKHELVPEMIILNGREGRHEIALHLLTHSLADYDTAIRYCLLGGSSIFHLQAASVAASQPTVLPSRDEQSKLFNLLLNEFFAIESGDARLERTAELLERFGGWFDAAKVLEQIPDEWSVQDVAGFLVHAFRRLVRDKNETVVVKALCSAQNLKKSLEVIEKSESVGPIMTTTPLQSDDLDGESYA